MSNWNLWRWGHKKGIRQFKKQKKQLSVDEFYEKFHYQKQDLGERDVLTIWDKENVLYYYAFTKFELKRLLMKAGFSLVKNYYSKKGKKRCKYRSDNIVTIAKFE